MAFWPSNDRKISDKSTSSKLHKQKGRLEHKRAYPYLEPGLVGAATFSADTLMWNFLSNPLLDTKASSYERLKFDQHAQVFPPTRALPSKLPRTSAKRHAEQGANFLRTYLPDVDVTSELIREQLTEDIAISRELERFDPHLGNPIVVFTSPSHQNEAFILFASGKTSSDLSMCAIVHTMDSKLEFYPQTIPLYTFQTPIQQLMLWNSTSGSMLTVRTFGSVNIMKLEEENDALSIDRIATLSSSDIDGETTVDMKPLSTSMGLLILGSKGGLFDCTFANGTKIITILHQVSEEVLKRQHTAEFWRLAMEDKWYSSFVMSTRDLLQFDTRSRSIVKLFPLDAGKHVFTAIEDVQQENLVQVCSTDRLWWFDPRYPGKPLLAYAHGREYDQYLSTSSIGADGQRRLTFLTSRNNSLVTVYDVSRNAEDLIQLNQSPYVLESTLNIYEKDVGHLFITQEPGLASVRVSERGALTYTTIRASNEETEAELLVKKTEEIKEMKTAALNLSVDNDSLGVSDFMEADLREVYRGLFEEHYEEQEELEEQTEESLNKMLDFFPYVLRNNELPVDHMLTTYDIAFRAGDEPEKTKRADFLTETALNIPKAYDSLKEGKLNPSSIKTPWHRSLASTMKRLDPEFRSDPAEMLEHLQKFNLAHDDSVPQSIKDFEHNSSKQLVVDLSLSSHAFSETSFAKSKEVDNTLETMTEALTIADELPPVEFGYLRPVEKKGYYKDGEEFEQGKAHVPLGARMLLKEWDDGDPDEYIYRDPYGVSSAEDKATGSSRPVAAIMQIRELVIQSQRPPTLVSSTAGQRLPGPIPPYLATSQPSKPLVSLKVQSQPMMQPSLTQAESLPMNLGRQDDFSQETAVPMVNTQVVPGPFGARPAVVKKKVTKKRVGGF